MLTRYLPRSTSLPRMVRSLSRSTYPFTNLSQAIMRNDKPRIEALLLNVDLSKDEARYGAFADASYPPLVLAVAQRGLQSILTGKHATNPDSKMVVAKLLTHNADPKQPDANGYPAVAYAVKTGDLESVKLMRPHYDPDLCVKDKYDASETFSLLAIAAFYGHLPVAEYLLAEGADPNAGVVPALPAAILGMSKSLEYYHYFNQQLESRKSLTRLLLNNAAEIDSAIQINSLYSLHPDLAQDIYYHQVGATALHFAAVIDSDLMRLLLENGANPNAKTRNGLKPLYFAAWQGKTSTLQLLLQAGAHADNQSLLAAAQQGNEAAFVKLWFAGADSPAAPIDGKNLMLAAAQGRSVGIINKLIAAGFAVNVQDKQSGNTPLHYAAKADHIEAVKALLAAKADPEALNQAGQQPLYFAAVGAAYKTIAELIKLGVQINAVDEKGNTPLFAYVMENSFRSISPAMIRTCVLLLENGADVYHKNKAGQTWEEYLDSTSPNYPNWQIAAMLRGYLKEASYLQTIKTMRGDYILDPDLDVFGYNVDRVPPAEEECLKAQLEILAPPHNDWQQLSEQQRYQYAYCPVFDKTPQVNFYRALQMLQLGRTGAKAALSHFFEEIFCLRDQDVKCQIKPLVGFTVAWLLVDYVELARRYWQRAKRLDARSAELEFHSVLQALPRFIRETIPAKLQRVTSDALVLSSASHPLPESSLSPPV